MIIKILGFFDIIAAIILFLSGFVNLAIPVLLLFCFFLISKGVFFLITSGSMGAESFANYIDIISGVLFYLSISFGLPKILLGLFSLLLIQKGVMSLAY